MNGDWWARPLAYAYLDPDAILGAPDFRVVEAFLEKTRRTQIGWHYVVDLTWLYSIAKHWPRTHRVLDAGGGNGVAQFLLLEMGFDVTNIDLFLQPPKRALVERYGASFEVFPSYRQTAYVDHLHDNFGAQSAGQRLKRTFTEGRLWRLFDCARYRHRLHAWQQSAGIGDRHPGRLRWVKGNLCHFPEIPGQSFDAVISVSALEHIPLADLSKAVEEIRRALKPAAKFAITTSGTDRDATWFHEPAKGLCFSDSDLQQIFSAALEPGLDAKHVLDLYRKNTYLKEHLADFYRQSGQNGMPWGKWDPSYIPVGLWR